MKISTKLTKLPSFMYLFIVEKIKANFLHDFKRQSSFLQKTLHEGWSFHLFQEHRARYSWFLGFFVQLLLLKCDAYTIKMMVMQCQTFLLSKTIWFAFCLGSQEAQNKFIFEISPHIIIFYFLYIFFISVFTFIFNCSIESAFIISHLEILVV